MRVLEEGQGLPGLQRNAHQPHTDLACRAWPATPMTHQRHTAGLTIQPHRGHQPRMDLLSQTGPTARTWPNSHKRTCPATQGPLVTLGPD